MNFKVFEIGEGEEEKLEREFVDLDFRVRNLLEGFLFPQKFVNENKKKKMVQSEGGRCHIYLY